MIIGIEGVSCTGKTTLAAHLATALGQPMVVSCYYHAAPDPAHLPTPFAANEAEQLRGLAVLLGIEALRREQARGALATDQVVILDRTVDTLLAHTYAVGELRKFRALPAARSMAVHDPAVMVPDVTLLLVGSPALLAERARTRSGMPPIFYAPLFTRHFNAYFEDEPLAKVCLPLDAALPPGHLLRCALEQLQRVGLAGSHTAVGSAARANL